MTQSSGDPNERGAWDRLLQWSARVLAVSFVAAGILFLLVEFDVVKGPGVPPGAPEDLPTQIGYFFADEHAVFPIEATAGLLFAVGFIALAAVGVALRGGAGRDDPASAVVGSAFGFAGGLGVVGQLLYIGVKRVAIDPAICQCPFATEQLISQERALDMIGEANDWLVAGTLLVAAIGMLAIPGVVARSASLSSAWARASQLLAVLFAIAVLGLLLRVEVLFQLIAGVGSVLLLPAWALWLDRQIARERVSAPV